MTWIYKNDNGRYLHSFNIHREVVEDTCWSGKQHDAYRFDERNRGAWVAFRCGSPGRLRRLRAKPAASTLSAEARTELERGSIIGAIKVHRALTGLGLWEAKQFIESTREGKLALARLASLPSSKDQETK